MFICRKNYILRVFYFSCMLIFSTGVCWKRKTCPSSHYTQNQLFFRNSQAFKIGGFPHRANSSFDDQRSVGTLFTVHPNNVTFFPSQRTVSMHQTFAILRRTRISSEDTKILQIINKQRVFPISFYQSITVVSRMQY